MVGGAWTYAHFAFRIYMRPAPTHDLDVLMREVLATGADLLALQTLEFHGSLTWSHRLLKGSLHGSP
jgi:hypothetical protein